MFHQWGGLLQKGLCNTKDLHNEVKDFGEKLLHFRKHLTVTALLRKYIDQK